MGACFSADANLKQQDKKINALLVDNTKRFLFAVTKNSGKTTILKQMCYLDQFVYLRKRREYHIVCD